MVSTNGHDQQRSICLRLRDVLYPRDAVALSSLNREVRGSEFRVYYAGAAAALSRLSVSSLPLCEKHRISGVGQWIGQRKA